MTTSVPQQMTSPDGWTGLQGFSPGLLNSLRPLLDADRLAFIGGYYERSRKSHKLATEASKKWEKRNDFLTDYCKQNNYSEHQTREKKRIDWGLNDAMDAWSWHAREAARCEAVIAMELNMLVLLGGRRAG